MRTQLWFFVQPQRHFLVTSLHPSRLTRLVGAEEQWMGSSTGRFHLARLDRRIIRTPLTTTKCWWVLSIVLRHQSWGLVNWGACYIWILRLSSFRFLIRLLTADGRFIRLLLLEKDDRECWWDYRETVGCVACMQTQATLAGVYWVPAGMLLWCLHL